MSRAASSSASGDSASVVALSLPPPQPGRRSSSSGRAVPSDEQRHAGRPFGEVVDEVEQPVVRPVQILEDENERAVLRERFEEPRASRRSTLARSPAPRAAEADERQQVLRPTSRSSSATALSTLARASRARRRGASFSRMPACAFTISPSAQKLTPSPYGSARPCRHHTISGRRVDAREELGHEPRLADPGHADERHELRLALAARAVERADERRRARARGRRAAQRRAARRSMPTRERACDRLPDGDGLALPLRRRPARARRSRSRRASRGRSTRRRGRRSPARPTAAARPC